MQKAEHLTFEIFSRSNQDTCLSQRPLVKQGQWVGKGQLLADCINSVSGDLALGKNALVAYMPWEGYNFEDSIVISDKLISEDVYTSIHILRFRTEIINTSTNSDTSFHTDTSVRDASPSVVQSKQTSTGLERVSSYKGSTDTSVRVTSHRTRSQDGQQFKQNEKTPVFKLSKTSLFRKPALVQINALHKTYVDQKEGVLLLAPLTTRFLCEAKSKHPFALQGKKKCSLSCFANYVPPFAPSVSKAKNCLLRSQSCPLLLTKLAPKVKGKATLSVRKVTTSVMVAVLSPSVRKARTHATPLLCAPAYGVKSPTGQSNHGLARKKHAIRNSKKYINNNNFGLERRTRDVPFLGSTLLSHLDNNGIAKVGTWVSPGDVLVGKVRPLANKFKSNRASTQLAWEIVSSRKNELMTMEDRSFRLPKGVSGRVIRTEVLKQPSGEHIHVYLAIKRKIQIGDKLAGRHGNKGIVSLVLSKQDMPYLADGTPIDIILSPLGVPSRMNVGQIYECLLGLAAKFLLCNFKVDNTMQTLSYSPKVTPAFPLPKVKGLLASSSPSPSVLTLLEAKGMRSKPVSLLASPPVKRYEVSTTSSKRYEVSTTFGERSIGVRGMLPGSQATLKAGVGKKSTVLQEHLKFSSTLEARNLVFLKLYHSRITRQAKWLFSLTHPGKMRLFDGRTGQPFASWITVGYAYMLKLIHLVDNKMHSRSTGPYSLITRQPVTGKARHGGQRIGEMEAWALEGFGAAYTLQEFFSFKGDDVSSRNQWQVTSISQLVGNTTAFKTLFSELRALCISLDFTGYTNF